MPLGQYFTISDKLQETVFNFVFFKNETLLEPSFGLGHLLIKFKEFNNNYPMVLYEIDKTLIPIIEFNENQKIIYDDFLTSFNKTFKTIIGNPPYISSKNSKNLYIQFIEKCFELLDTNGELIFIVPSDFLKLTRASQIITKMSLSGSFTHFYRPNNEKLFKEASIDVVVFRYQKDLKNTNHTTIVNDIPQTIHINNGIINFNLKNNNIRLDSLFDIYVGIVSGLDSVFKNNKFNETIDVLINQHMIEKFILIDKFPSSNNDLNNYLLENKDKLLARKIRKFNETNWYEWGALRNIKKIQRSLNKKCIYIKTLTRSNEVAFIDKVQYFGGSLICLIPKTEISLDPIVKYLNLEEFTNNYKYSGRYKFGHKQICNIFI